MTVYGHPPSKIWPNLFPIRQLPSNFLSNPINQSLSFSKRPQVQRSVTRYKQREDKRQAAVVKGEDAMPADTTTNLYRSLLFRFFPSLPLTQPFTHAATAISLRNTAVTLHKRIIEFFKLNNKLNNDGHVFKPNKLL